MYKYEISICTPTYNRGEKIKKLFESLQRQQNKRFEWVIVDDGSKDDTTEAVEKFKKVSDFPIKYIKKLNGGKHTALNEALGYIEGKYTLIVDSDDTMSDNAINKLIPYLKNIDSDEEVCGICSWRLKDNGELFCSRFPQNEMKESFLDLNYKLNLSGEYTLTIKTNIMKKYKFPEYDNIKFITESVVWHDISGKYKFLCINEPTVIGDYLEDGLTNSIWKNKELLKGLAYSNLYIINNNIYNKKEYFKLWIKSYIDLIRFSLLSDVNYYNHINKSKDRLIYTTVYPLGYMLYLKSKAKVS